MSGFSLKFNPKSLELALTGASAVINTSNAPTGKNFLLEVKDEKVHLVAFTSDTFVRLRVAECKTKGDGAFAFLPERLQGVIKGRTEMIFDYDGADCKFRLVKGKYAGTFVTMPMAHDHTSVYGAFMKKLRAEANASTLKPEVMQTIREGLKLTRLKDVYQEKPLLSYVDMKDGEITITSLDNNHFAQYKTKAKSKQPFRLALPMTHFNVIDRVLEEDAKAVFDATATHLRIETGTAGVILPATQTDPESFDVVPGFFEDMAKPVFVATCDQAELQTMMDNMFTMYTPDSRMAFSHKADSGELKVSISTANGSADDSITMKVKTSGKFQEYVDPRLFKDSLGLLKGQDKVRIAVLKGAAVILTCGSAESGQVSIVTSVSE